MKITKEQLKQIIKEELDAVLEYSQVGINDVLSKVDGQINYENAGSINLNIDGEEYGARELQNLDRGVYSDYVSKLMDFRKSSAGKMGAAGASKQNLENRLGEVGVMLLVLIYKAMNIDHSGGIPDQDGLALMQKLKKVR